MFFSFCERLMLSFVAHPVNPSSATRQSVPTGSCCLPKWVMSQHPGLNLPSTGISSASCDNFQVLSLHDCQLIARPIMHGPQCFEFFAELSRVRVIQRSERAIRRPIVLPKELHHFSGWKGVHKVV